MVVIAILISLLLIWLIGITIWEVFFPPRLHEDEDDYWHFY